MQVLQVVVFVGEECPRKREYLYKWMCEHTAQGGVRWVLLRDLDFRDIAELTGLSMSKMSQVKMRYMQEMLRIGCNVLMYVDSSDDVARIFDVVGALHEGNAASQVLVTLHHSARWENLEV